MTEEIQRGTKRRQASNKRSNFKKAKKNQKLRIVGSNENAKESFKVKKVDRKMKKMFQKRARDYNSDDDEDNGEEDKELLNNDEIDEVREESLDNEEGGENMDEINEGSEDEEGEIQPGIMRFAEGCKAFRLAFKKITKRTSSTDDDILGPVLSAHKKLVAEKLAEEEAEHKVKGEAKKEKHLAAEKGHVKPANYLDSHEKFLIGVATRGVVKLFNAVNKAQHAQKGLNPSRSKDEKAIRRRRKEAFFSELGKKSSQPFVAKVGPSTGNGDGGGPAWAPLRDNYMLTNSKLKDWDKMPETTVADDFGKPPDTDTSSEDD